MNSSKRNTAPLRILFVDPAGKLWGSERSLLELIRATDKNKFTIAVCLPANSDLSNILLNEGVKILPYFKAELDKNGTIFNKLMAFFGLIFSIFIHKPDIVHLNQAGAVRYIGAACKYLRVPYIIHVRLFEDIPLLRKRLKQEDRYRLIANSNYVYNGLIDAGFNQKNVTHVVNPVVLAEKRPYMTLREMLGEIDLSNAFLIGYVGRLSEDKGIGFFLKAMKSVIVKTPNAHAIIIGDSNGRIDQSGRDYLEAMKDLTVVLGIENNCHFLGFQKQAPMLMTELDLFVLPSREEPWGRVVCEALLADVPVIATNSGGVTDIIVHERTGILVTYGDVERLTKSILFCIHDWKLAMSWQEQGKKWVENNCSPEKHAKNVQLVYEQLLTKR